MTDDDDPLADPTVIAALRIIGNRQPHTNLCPDCSRNHVDHAGNRCDPCTDEAERTRRRTWWNEQNDYPQLVVRHGQREAASRWLAHQLRRGPIDSTELSDRADRAGIAPRTYWRALRQLRTEGVGDRTDRRYLRGDRDDDNGRVVVYHLARLPPGSADRAASSRHRNSTTGDTR